MNSYFAHPVTILAIHIYIHIHVTGTTMDQTETSSLSLNQTYLAEPLRELSEVVRVFPVRV